MQIISPILVIIGVVSFLASIFIIGGGKICEPELIFTDINNGMYCIFLYQLLPFIYCKDINLLGKLIIALILLIPSIPWIVLTTAIALLVKAIQIVVKVFKIVFRNREV